jgi:ElaB/YqjD/DUF883 family membrane-anchored ribosome-binding protein
MDPINKFASDASVGADKLAGKLHNGINETYRDAKGAGSKLADKADDISGQLADNADAVVDEAKGRLKDGIRSVKDAAKQARDTVGDSADSVIAYTRENPVKALLIAAVSGAFLWTLARAMGTARD